MANFAFHNFLNDEEQGIEELTIDDLFVDFLRECDQAGIYYLLRLVFRVGEVIVEINYLLQ